MLKSYTNIKYYYISFLCNSLNKFSLLRLYFSKKSIYPSKNNYNIRKITLSIMLIILIILFIISFKDIKNKNIFNNLSSAQIKLSFYKQLVNYEYLIKNLCKKNIIDTFFDKEITINNTEMLALKNLSDLYIKKEKIKIITPLQFNFYDKLPQKKINIENTHIKIYRYTYMLQVGSYRKYTHTNLIQDNLILVGLKPIVTKVGEWYRVDVGPIYSKHDANIIKSKIQKIGIFESILRQVNKEEISIDKRIKNNEEPNSDI